MTKPMTSLSVAMALAGAVTIAGAYGLSATPSEAASSVKCYGIAKAGENDCANAAGTHSCSGQTTVNYSGLDWKAVESEEACVAADGKLEPFEGKNPNKEA